MTDKTTLIFPAATNSGWLCHRQPRHLIRADSLAAVNHAIRQADAEIARGREVAGFVSYEAAAAFDAAQQTHPPDPTLPLVWLAVFDQPPAPQASIKTSAAFITGQIRAAVGVRQHARAVAEIDRRITAGDVYQVNYTYPLRAKFIGSAAALFAKLTAAQPSPWSFFIDTPQWAVCSASPECFFDQSGDQIITRPMKGTRPAAAAAELLLSAKDRAENLMIVDLLRNDLSRLPKVRDVCAGPLLQIEQYPTVAQMTSTVRCRSAANLADLFAALFPCASVTGAPKIAAMKQIRALEMGARGVYCGAIGRAGPGFARFNVAIRTAVIDKIHNRVRYDVGGGIVADSTAAAERAECETKAAVFISLPPARLIETMAVRQGKIPLLDTHLQRLVRSAKRLGFVCAAAALSDKLTRAAKRQDTAKLRLLLSPNGQVSITAAPLPSNDAAPRLTIFTKPMRADNPLLPHKTTRRQFYARALRFARRHGYEDAVLFNERGELTETCIANIALRINGSWRTPHVKCGLLPGVMRRTLLAQGIIKQAILRRRDLGRADKVCRFNAVRGMEEIIVDSGTP